jgi:hypothetical protein
MQLQTALVSNFDLEIFSWRKTSEVVENADESSFGEGQQAGEKRFDCPWPPPTLEGSSLRPY